MDKAENRRCTDRPPLVETARAALERHSQFRGRSNRFAIEEDEGKLVIAGTVPTFYLKQLLQSLLQDVSGVKRVINRVNVMSAEGLSDCPLARRERCVSDAAGLQKEPECFRTCPGAPGDAEEPAPPRHLRGAQNLALR